jgi:hypothetical protein
VKAKELRIVIPAAREHALVALSVLTMSSAALAPAQARAAEPMKVAVLEEVMPIESYGGRLPGPLLGILVDSFEKAAGVRVLRAASGSAADGAPATDSLVPALLSAYADALAEYTKSRSDEAYHRLYLLQDSVQSDARRYLRDPRVADALADTFLLLADIDLGRGRLEDAKAWLRSYVMSFPVREPDAGRYGAELLKRLSEMRTNLRTTGGGSALLRAPGPTWRVHMNGTLMGRGEVRIPWLPEGTYYAYAADGERVGAVADLDVWNGKETRLDLGGPSEAGADPLVRKFATVDELSAWNDSHTANVTRLATDRGVEGVLVLRVATRTVTSEPMWSGAGWSISAWVFRAGEGLGWSAVVLKDPADKAAMSEALRRFGAELGGAYRAASPGKGAAPAPVAPDTLGKKKKKKPKKGK